MSISRFSNAILRSNSEPRPAKCAGDSAGCQCESRIHALRRRSRGILLHRFRKHGSDQFQQHSQNQKTESPDSGCDFPFHKARSILDDFVESRWNKAGDDQAHAFFNPDANDTQDTRRDSYRTAFQSRRTEEQCRPERARLSKYQTTRTPSALAFRGERSSGVRLFVTTNAAPRATAVDARNSSLRPDHPPEESTAAPPDASRERWQSHPLPVPIRVQLIRGWADAAFTNARGPQIRVAGERDAGVRHGFNPAGGIVEIIRRTIVHANNGTFPG